MTTITEPLRNEHAHLLPHIEALRGIADQVGDVSVQSLGQEIDGAYAFLTRHLIPHAEAEDEVLYPAVERAMGAPGATATMRRDHVEVRRLTDELGSLRPALAGVELDAQRARALRRVLYGLHALVMVHFAKEEEIYLPLLDQRLSAEDARELFASMERALPNEGSGVDQRGATTPHAKRVMGRPVVHFEIGGADIARSQEFYSQLFGWSIQVDGGYGLVDTQADGGINGGIMRQPEGVPPWVTVYVGVDDLRGTLEHAEKLGGKTVREPTPVGDIGSSALLADPDGNVIGLFAERA
jgi:predicted enzyme related to lactoylglutathione lyase/iron-sulfur cluster repair protein YtfE (RIC family)